MPKLSAESSRHLERPEPTLRVSGFELYQALIAPDAQAAVMEVVRSVVASAPFVAPVTPGSRQMSVRMTNAGRVGWTTDRKGYRYEPLDPSGRPWPPIPDPVLTIWRGVTGLDRDPDSCLINYYGEGARMGLHQDRDEGDFSWPVVSISLGDSALFRMGGVERSAPTRGVWLASGDVVVMGGAARLAWHGVDRVRHGSSRLLPEGGRINLTLRVVQD